MTKFSDLKLDPKVLKAVAEAGYETPTPIQAGAIPPALAGRDVLGIAQTGTGKTASFTLPMITLLGRGRARARMPRSLVLCPTRELAAQVAENFDTYAKHTRLTKALLIGGVSFGEQDKLIDRGVDVLIATPGRLLDHFERGRLLLTGVQIMVVDEADRMLDMGFIPDIERIFQLTPFTRQTLFFSATMAPEIERITDTFLHAPERIEVARQATTSETITQKLIEITPTRRDQSAKQKRELLRALIRSEGEGLKNAIIFCNRKTDVDIVAKSLKAHGFDAAPIHGDLEQRHRTATLDEFRDGKLRLLVASDVAARGLDIPAVSHVINFDLPSHAEDYVHRIGRTGRAGRLGTAISIGTPADHKYLAAIEGLVKHALPRGEIPEGFTLTEASQDAPRPRENSNRRERGGRDRDRQGGRRHDGESRAESRAESRTESRAETRTDDKLETRPVAQAERAERPAREERSREERPRDERPRDDRPRDERPREDRARDDRSRDERPRDERHREDRPRESRDDRPRESREDRPRDDRRDRHHDRGERGERHGPVGLGDHLPEFMTRSFRPRIIESGNSVSDEAAETVAPTAEAAQPRSDAKPARSRNRGSRKSSAQPSHEAAPGDQDAPVQTAAEPLTEATPAPLPVIETPMIDLPAATVTTPEPAAEVAADPAKPARRTRAPRRTNKAADEAQPDSALTGEPTAEAVKAPAKPRRKAAAKKPAAEAAAEGGAEPKPVKARAPRKPRAKAADAETSADSAPTTGADDKAEV